MPASVEKVKSIVFDWDGTIVNTMSLKVQNAGILFAREYGADPEVVIDSYRKYSGISRRELFDTIARESIGRGLGDLEFKRLSNRFTALNLESYKANKVFQESTRTVLQWLKTQDFLLFVSSSAMQDEIESLAEHLEIESFFTEILGSKGPFKKGKAHIDHIRSRYDLTLNEIIFIGDEKADMRLAGRLGVLSIGISAGKHEEELRTEFADYIVNDISGIKEILARV